MARRNFSYPGANQGLNRFKVKSIPKKVELTPDEEELIPQYVDKWSKICNSLEYSDEEIIKSIEWLYNTIGLDKPNVLIFDSPESYKFDNYTDNYQMYVDSINSKFRTFLLEKLILKVDKNLDAKIVNKVNIYLLKNNRGQGTFNGLQSAIMDSLTNSVIKKISDEQKLNIRNIVLKYDKYNFSSFAMLYDYLTDILDMKNKDSIDFLQFVKNTGFFTIFFEDTALVSRPPIIIHHDDLGRFHGEGTAAIQFNDGFKIYFLYGVLMTEEEFKNYILNKIPGELIMSIPNADLRTALIQFYGYDYVFDYLPELNEIDRWKTKQAGTDYDVEYVLFEYKHTRWRVARVIRCEWWEQGHKETAVLGVPREEMTETCKGALAWTFGMTTDEYNLIKEA